METATLYSLDDEILDRYKKIQTKINFSRTVEGNSESVSYLPDSSIRFWLNDESTEYPLHWHPAIEMVIPLVNGYTAIVGQETYQLTPGDILVIPGGDLHHLIAPSSGKRLIYLFDFSLLSKIRGYSFLNSYLSQPILINRDTCRPIYNEEAAIISQLCRDYFSNDSLREMMIYSQLVTFFINYVRYRSSLNDRESGHPLGEARQRDLLERFNTVFNYLDEHFTENLTLEQVADVAGFSKFHFSRLFKQCSGYNFYDFLCYKRIKSAEILLAKTGTSITEVALQSGFSSLSTFNRTYKRITGCTPSEYRSLCNVQMDFADRTP